MTDIPIPPEALEAAKETWYANQHRGTDDRMSAACLAMLEAWQTEKHKMIVGVAIDEVGGQCPAIILPLPQEKSE